MKNFGIAQEIIKVYISFPCFYDKSKIYDCYTTFADYFIWGIEDNLSKRGVNKSRKALKKKKNRKNFFESLIFFF